MIVNIVAEDLDDVEVCLQTTAEGRLELTLSRRDGEPCWVFDHAELDVLLSVVKEAIRLRDEYLAPGS
jgi:hypothetical protein